MSEKVTDRPGTAQQFPMCPQGGRILPLPAALGLDRWLWQCRGAPLMLGGVMVPPEVAPRAACPGLQVLARLGLLSSQVGPGLA